MQRHRPLNGRSSHRSSNRHRDSLCQSLTDRISPKRVSLSARRVTSLRSFTYRYRYWCWVYVRALSMTDRASPSSFCLYSTTLIDCTYQRNPLHPGAVTRKWACSGSPSRVKLGDHQHPLADVNAYVRVPCPSHEGSPLQLCLFPISPLSMFSEYFA